MLTLTDRQQTLLQFLGGSESAETDPIRIMKGLFLFAQKTPGAWLPEETKYVFKAYDYGPCSFDIYDDLKFLESAGLILSKQRPGESWKRYQISEKGKLALEKSSVNPQALAYLKTIRSFVDSLSFSQLLKTVYKEFPNYAVNSVFKG